MKKRFLCITFMLFALLWLVPLRASACGGFVAVYGERIFHSVYCDKLVGVAINTLRWFGTSSEAELCGFTICEDCAPFYDWSYDDTDCATFWKTDDPLLNTAMELSFDYGTYSGFEAGVESAREDLRNEYESGYDAGYQDGAYDGKAEAESDAQIREERIAEERRQSWYHLFWVIVFLISVSYIINWLDSRKK